MLRGHVGLIALVIAIVSTAMACGSGDSEESRSVKPLTVEEYAAKVCDPVDLPDGVTWKQYRDKLRADIDRGEGVVPPQEVRDYHLSIIAAMRETLKATNDFAPEAQVNPYELTTNSEFVLKLALAVEAQQGLDDETSQTLIKHGCSVERAE